MSNAIHQLSQSLGDIINLSRYILCEALNAEGYLKTILKKESSMDKQINKVKKDLKSGLKDTKTLLKMDKKFDAKLAKCGSKMKKGSK
jgi:hypothetical protein